MAQVIEMARTNTVIGGGFCTAAASSGPLPNMAHVNSVSSGGYYCYYH